MFAEIRTTDGGAAGAVSVPPKRSLETRVLSRLIRLVLARARAVLAVAVLVAAVSAILGGTVLSAMSSQVGDPSAQSARADRTIAHASGVSADGHDLLILVRLPNTWPSAADRSAVRRVSATLSRVPGVVDGLTPSEDPGSLISRLGTRALITASVSANRSSDDVANAVRAAFAGRPDVAVGGRAVVALELGERVGTDLARAVWIVLPLLFLLLAWIFRGLVAALVPLVVGSLAVVVTMAALRGVIEFASVSQYILNLMFGLGLGLGSGYSLLIVSRYRDEVATGGYGREAALHAGIRAGRTVVFSAVTIVAAMSSLLLFPQKLLYSMGVGGVIVTLAAASAAVVVVPALLAVLGPRIDALPLGRRQRVVERAPIEATAGRWSRLAHWVTAQARWVLPAAALVCVLIALPVFTTRGGSPDATSLPVSSSARTVSDTVARDFPQQSGTTVRLAVHATPSADAPRVLALSQRVAAQPGVRSVSTSYLGSDEWVISARIGTGPFTTSAADSIRALRALPTRLPVLVGGDAAAYLDLRDSVTSLLPWALVLAALVVLVMIFLLTGSVVVPVTAVLLSGLSALMSVGVLVWVFQSGHLTNLLDFASTGRIDLTVPIVVAIIAFGLSAGYGVVVLARIKQAHDEGHQDAEAIPIGIGSTGHVVSSAALVLAVAIGASSASSVLIVKQVGVGAVVAVLLDAVLVRVLLLPSAMRVLSGANWWAPRPLRRLPEKLSGVAIPQFPRHPAAARGYRAFPTGSEHPGMQAAHAEAARIEAARAGTQVAADSGGAAGAQRAQGQARSADRAPTRMYAQTERRTKEDDEVDLPANVIPIVPPTSEPSRFTGLTVQIQVGDPIQGRIFYTRLFGRAPDAAPIEDFMEWRVVPDAPVWWQIVHLPMPVEPMQTRARLQVGDVDAAAAWAAAELGVDVDPITRIDGVIAFADFEDPWGNRLGFYEDRFPDDEEPDGPSDRWSRRG